MLNPFRLFYVSISSIFELLANNYDHGYIYTDILGRIFSTIN